MVTLELALVALVAVLLVVASVFDWRQRIIPDSVNAAIALLAIPYWYATGLGLWPDIAIQLGMALAVFAVFLGVFALGQMGGGDVKLLVALALFQSPIDFIRTLLVMAISGGVLTVVMVIHHRRQGGDAPFENPYGIAIAFGALAAMSERYLNHLA